MERCNLQGLAKIPSDQGWEEPLASLFRKCSIIDHTGYPGFENSTFRVRGYDYDPECTCGFDELLAQFGAEHPHSEDCYQIAWQRAMAEYDEESGYSKLRSHSYAWRNALVRRDKVEEDLLKKLCSERSLTYPENRLNHCDCPRNPAMETWVSTNFHTESCRIFQPNFLFKLTRFKIYWYKYPLREGYMIPEITLDEFCKLLKVCEESL